MWICDISFVKCSNFVHFALADLQQLELLTSSDFVHFVGFGLQQPGEPLTLLHLEHFT